MNEGLDKNQKRAGQLGPTEKVGKNGPRGKLFGANESADGNAQSTKMFLEVDDDDELLDEADLIISPALFGKGDRSFKPKHADHEVSMARNDCFQSAVNAAKVFKMLRNVSEMQGIDGWVASKITLAADYLNTVREYLEGQQIERNSMQSVAEEKLDELKCWPGYTRVQGVPAGAPGSCKKKSKTKESVTEGTYKRMKCPECGGAAYGDEMLAEKRDACYHKVKSRYKVWPSAYASGALVKCRKVGAKNWGNKSGK